MIGKQRINEITSKSVLLDVLKSADFDLVKVWDDVTSGQEAKNYIRRHFDLKHSVIVISHKEEK